LFSNGAFLGHPSVCANNAGCQGVDCTSPLKKEKGDIFLSKLQKDGMEEARKGGFLAFSKD
jgi:hypothetical protein